MKKIVKENKLIKRLELSKEEALEMFANDPYKIDIIENLNEDEVISAYKQEDFVDLCRGPHVESTKLLKHFKLLKHSGAYYKGDTANKRFKEFYLYLTLYEAYYYSKFSENMTRRIAMEEASNNASDMKEELRNRFNQLRQEEITQEILELSAGVE